MRNLICYLFGHKKGELNDSGYPVCERCNSHSFYDDWNDSAYFMKPFWIVKGKIKCIIWDISFWWDTKFNGNKLPF